MDPFFVFTFLPETEGEKKKVCVLRALEASEDLVQILFDLRNCQKDNTRWKNMHELYQKVQAGFGSEDMGGLMTPGHSLTMDYETALRVLLALVDAKGLTPMEEERKFLEYHYRSVVDHFTEEYRQSAERKKWREAI